MGTQFPVSFSMRVTTRKHITKKRVCAAISREITFFFPLAFYGHRIVFIPGGMVDHLSPYLRNLCCSKQV